MTDVSSRLEHATALASTGRIDEALRICRAEPAPELRRLEGQILQAQGREAEAADVYAAVVADDPADWEIWNNLGNVRRALGDGEGALGALRQAAAIRPDVL